MMNNNDRDVRVPNDGVGIIFTPGKLHPRGTNPRGSNDHGYPEGHPRYWATHPERGVHIQGGPRGGPSTCT